MSIALIQVTSLVNSSNVGFLLSITLSSKVLADLIPSFRISLKECGAKGDLGLEEGMTLRTVRD